MSTRASPQTSPSPLRPVRATPHDRPRSDIACPRPRRGSLVWLFRCSFTMSTPPDTVSAAGSLSPRTRTGEIETATTTGAGGG